MAVTGNPLHDQLVLNDGETAKRRVQNYLRRHGRNLSGRRIILIATCLHTEYDGRENPPALYREFIRQIYRAIDVEKQFAIVKMHPSDSVCPNIYAEELPPEKRNDVLILEPSEPGPSIYELLHVSNLLITRGSTVAEEMLLLGGKVLLYDLFSDGPSADLDFVIGQPETTLLVGRNAHLRPVIQSLISDCERRVPPDEKYVEAITYRLDGNSTARAIQALVHFASHSPYAESDRT